MATNLSYLSTLAVVAVFAVLVLGLWNMSREGAANTSQKLMRWRVLLQFVAIVALMLAVLARRW